MAGGQERVLRRRIKSIEATKKITRAMELIAATRVVKAQDRAGRARPYAEEITSVILDLVRVGAAKEHPLLDENADTNTACLLVVTSDRGLCGAYNNSVIRLAEREISELRSAGRPYVLIVVGKKAEGYFRFRGYDIDASFLGVTDQPTYEQAAEIAEAFRRRFESGELETVDLVYTRFITVASQEPVVRRFLPLRVDEDAGGPEIAADLDYEPDPTAILNELLPRYVEARVYSALLDASAAEHAARQRAMKAATDNADDLKTKLTRIMNRARQDAITTEIMEIVGGAEALGKDKGSPEELMPDYLNPEHLFSQQLAPTDHEPSLH